MTTTQQLRTHLYVDGAWKDGSGGTITTLNPATALPIADIAAAGTADVDAAVAAASRALRGPWGELLPSRRGELLRKLADLVERDAETLAALESLEIGTPIGQTRAMYPTNLAGTLRYYAGWADKINGSVLANDGYFGSPTHAYTRREPIGVIAAIVPWNAPMMVCGWKLAPALACGNTVIIKPAEDASLSILHLASLAEEAGLPPGVVNVLPGVGDVVGEALSLHPGVRKVSFTGSAAVGQRILRNSAADFKRTTLELGGKSPQIVFADADLESAVRGVAMGLFFNQGEVCAAGTRVFVHRSVYDDVVAGLQEAAQGQVVGDPFDPATTMGPLVNERQRDRVVGYLERGKREGAKLVAGGSPSPGAGFFVQATVFADATNDMAIAREEIFGPVGTVIPFDSEDAAVAMANDSQYGLAATVWTRDLSRAHTIAHRLHAGAVGVNGWAPLAPALPWGGLKFSGVGRELGYEGILANTEEKTVTIVL